MKTKLIIFILLITMGEILISSCTNITPKPVLKDSAITFKAIVNGLPESWSTFSYQHLLSGGVLIRAYNQRKPKIQLGIMNSCLTGTYSIGDMVMANYWGSDNMAHSADKGTITITSFSNNKISGTFEFTENDGMILTNGKFSNIPEQYGEN